MCPTCWELRARTVAPAIAYAETRLQTAALVLGAISLVPFCAVQIAALVVGVLALVQAKAGPALAARWKGKLGLALLGAGLVVDALLFFFISSR
jgi:hypothetical protein